MTSVGSVTLPAAIPAEALVPNASSAPSEKIAFPGTMVSFEQSKSTSNFTSRSEISTGENFPAGIAALPGEILSIIFSRLEFHDFANASEVCVQWYKFSLTILPTNLRQLFATKPALFGKVDSCGFNNLVLCGSRFAYGVSEAPRPGAHLHDLKTGQEAHYNSEYGFVHRYFLHLTEKNLLVGEEQGGSTIRGLESCKIYPLWEKERSKSIQFGPGGPIEYAWDATNNLLVIIKDFVVKKPADEQRMIILTGTGVEKNDFSSIPFTAFKTRGISVFGGKIVLIYCPFDPLVDTYLDCYDVLSSKLLNRRIFSEAKQRLGLKVASNEEVIVISNEEVIGFGEDLNFEKLNCKEVLVLDLNTLETLYTIPLPFCIAHFYIHDSKLIGIPPFLGEERKIFLFDLKKGEMEAILDGVNGAVFGRSLWPRTCYANVLDGDWMLASCANTFGVKIWNLKTGFSFQKKTLDRVQELCFRRGSTTELPCLVARLTDGRVQVWHLFSDNKPSDPNPSCMESTINGLKKL